MHRCYSYSSYDNWGDWGLDRSSSSRDIRIHHITFLSSYEEKQVFLYLKLERGQKLRRIIILILFMIVFAVLSVIGYSHFIEPNLLLTKSLVIKTQKMIEPCTVVYFTDTHFGKYYDVKHARKIVEKINKEKPDIVVFGGDLLDNFARDRDHMDLQYLKEELQKIEAKSGKYAVWGNHDYGGGAVRIYEDFMTSCGFEILDNKSVELADFGIKLIGYDDYLMGWTDPSLYNIESDLFNVIIAHEPIVSQFIESKSENFLLAGHTHGGQVSIPFITNRLLPEGSGQFKKGYYTEKEINATISLRMYTSSGIGMTRYPFRFLNPPEIIQIKFQQGD